jgi:exosortase
MIFCHENCFDGKKKIHRLVDNIVYILPVWQNIWKNFPGSDSKPPVFFVTSMETAVKPKYSFLVPAAFGLLLLIYLPVIIGLAVEWYNDDNYSHGFLVPLISAFLLFLRHGNFNEFLNPPGSSLTFQKIIITAVVGTVVISFFSGVELAVIIMLNITAWFLIIRGFVFESRQNRLTGWVSQTGNISGLPLLIFGMIIFVLATAAAEYFTLRLSLVLTLYGLVWYLLGRRFALGAWFEFAFLLFMIPWPYVVYFAATFPMQLFATKVTVGILNLIGMSAIQQGNMIHLPGYSLEVAEACSGLRSLISLLALGAVYARFTQKGLPRQIILFLSTIPIAIAANIFRILFTAVGAYTVSRELAEDFLHELSGMMVFVVAFIMLFVFGAILKIGTGKK